MGSPGQTKLCSGSLAPLFSSWLLGASLDPFPPLGEAGEVLLLLLCDPRGQDVVLPELCISAAPELCSSCPVPRPPAIKTALNWSQGLVFGSPCGNNSEDFEAFTRPSEGFANEPLPVPHISSQTRRETTRVHGEAFLLLQRRQKCSHANVSGFCFHLGAQSSSVPPIFCLPEPPWAELES